MNKDKEVLYNLMENYFYNCELYGYSTFDSWCDDNLENEEQKRLMLKMNSWVDNIACLLFGGNDIKIYNSFPTIDEIKSDYYELLELIKNIGTIKQAQEFERKTGIEVEINGLTIDEYIEIGGTNEAMIFIKYKNFGCLDYIHNRLDKYITFNVYSEFCNCDFIKNITIDKLTEEFLEESIKEAMNNKL